MLFEEIESLKSHFGLGKKTWFQLLKVKIVDVAIDKVIEEAIRNQHLRLSDLSKAKYTKKAIETLTFEDVEEFSTVVKPNMASGGIGFKV